MTDLLIKAAVIATMVAFVVGAVMYFAFVFVMGSWHWWRDRKLDAFFHRHDWRKRLPF